MGVFSGHQGPNPYVPPAAWLSGAVSGSGRKPILSLLGGLPVGDLLPDVGIHEPGSSRLPVVPVDIESRQNEIRKYDETFVAERGSAYAECQAMCSKKFSDDIMLDWSGRRATGPAAVSMMRVCIRDCLAGKGIHDY